MGIQIDLCYTFYFIYVFSMCMYTNVGTCGPQCTCEDQRAALGVTLVTRVHLDKAEPLTYVPLDTPV